MKIDYPSLILNLRATLNLNQEEFGKLIGASLISVSRWERGEHEPTKLVKVRLVNLAKEHNVDIKEVNE